MEISKLQKRKQKAQEESNQKVVAELCNKLGNHLISVLKYTEALDEFKEESKIYSLLNKKIDFGRANRMIGEVYLLMERYKDALNHENIYLKSAKQANDLVEMQRAHATIGRCYLLLAEDKSANGSVDAPADFKAAEKSFLKSLMICKELNKLVSKWELADMQARLYLNLGVTKEQLEANDDAVNYYETAIKISKANDLFELNHKCLMANGFLYFMKKDDSNSALNIFNRALEVAKRIQDKNEKMCETLLAKSSVLIQNGDNQSAKQVLKKAYRLQSPNSSDKEAIEKKLKIVLMLCRSEDSLVTTNSYDYAKRKELFEKLGDGSCRLKNYVKAIEFYCKTLEAAQLNGEKEQQLIPIYVSLYQTYIDNKQYNEALEFMKKEYELIQDEPKEAAVTLMGLGNLLDLAGKDFWEAETMYKKALNEARKAEDLTLEKEIIRKFLKFCRRRNRINVAEMMEQEATQKGIDLTPDCEDTECTEDIVELSNDFDLDLQLSSDPESSDDENKRATKTENTARKRRPAITVKKNAKGETKLHEACINGNYQLAKMLIEQGHALNVRDNAGWLPLHEAAIHGFRDVVELLLDNGGQTAINDKGGTSCDGITPLYDAASNGNLSVVQLLLDRGAKSTVKTDFNETPLDALFRWFGDYGPKLSPTELEFYTEIKLRFEEEFKKIGVDVSAKKQNTASSGYNSAPLRDSQQKRVETNFSDESENSVENSEEIKKNARMEYKNAMKSLKTSKPDQSFGDRLIESKRRSAHLMTREVEVDDWLEDDLAPMRKKQKFLSNNLPNVQSPLKKTPEKNFARKPSSLLLDFDSDGEKSDTSDGATNAFDVVMNAGDCPVTKPKRRNSTKSLSKPPSQPSLLDSGFSRFMGQKEVYASSPVKASTSGSSFNDSSTAHHIEKPMIIRVQVGDEKILVPVTNEAAGELNISWLTEEVARRYYSIKGIQPDLKLKTADGATLLLDDPIAVVLSFNESSCIQSEVLEWKLPTLSKRYIEACSDLKSNIDHDITEFLEVNRSAATLNLFNRNLCSSTLRPIMKALQHQNCLMELNLSNNFIGNDGVKSISQMLSTLKELEVLDISGNMIDDQGLEQLSNALEKNLTLTEIKQLKLSFNPIQSSSMSSISALCRSKRIATIFIAGCDFMEPDDFGLLESIKFIDLSYNHFTAKGFKVIVSKLNPNILETLNLERCSIECNLGNSLVQVLTSKTFTALKEINLSGLNFNENEILDILRGLEKCDQLRKLNLSHQKDLTFLSLKYILINMDSRNLQQVKLIGCKRLQCIDNMFSINSIDSHCPKSIQNVEISLPNAKTNFDERETFIEKMKELWKVISESRGKVEHDGNILRLTQTDESTKENNFY